MIVSAHDGVQLNYEVSGPDDAPLVLMLHGATLDHRSWDAQLPALGDYLVARPDARAHGASMLDRPFRYEDAVQDVRTLLATFGERPTVLVGLSMGGYLVQSILRDCPPQVRGAVVVDAPCTTAPRGRMSGLQLALGKAALKAYPSSLMLKQVPKRTAVRPDVQRYVHETFSRIPHDRVVELMCVLLDSVFTPDPAWRVPVPTLLLCGTEDRLAGTRKELPAWSDRDPGCSFALVPQAGHASNQDNPEGFNALLLEHLERVLPKPVPVKGSRRR